MLSPASSSFNANRDLSRNSSFNFSLSLLLSSATFAAALLFVDVNENPPYFDYDAATEAIFVNNHTFRNSYDFGFRSSNRPQDIFRVGYAAHRISLSYPISLLHRALGIEAAHTHLFMKILAGAFFMLGAWLAALTLASSVRARLFVFTVTIAFPPVLLGARTGYMFFGALFILYWAILMNVRKYLETNRRRYVIGGALCLGYYLANPWTPIIYLAPPLLLLSYFHRTKIVASDILLGGSISLIVAATTHFLASLVAGNSFGEYWKEVSFYRAARLSSAVSDFLSLDANIARAKMFCEQMLFFTRELKPITRQDDLWSIGEYHFVWLLFVAALVVGVSRIAKEQRWIAFSVVAIILMSITVSYPESRYLSVLPPYIAALIYLGFDANKNKRAQLLAAAAALLMTVNTAWKLFTDYNNFMVSRWSYMDGMEEIVSLLPNEPVSVLFATPRNYENELYVTMLSNWRVKYVVPGEDCSAPCYEVRTVRDLNLERSAQGRFAVKSAVTKKRYLVYRIKGTRQKSSSAASS
jgi:hypothetical protein